MLENEKKRPIAVKVQTKRAVPKKLPTYEAEDEILRQLENSRIQFERTWGYQELKGWVDGFYKDGQIENAELTNMTNARSDILLDYQIAQDLIAKMDRQSPQYVAAQRVMTHLYNCYMLINNAVNKGKIYNSLTNEQKMRREARSHQTETLDLEVENQMEADLLASLSTKKSRMTAEQVFHREAMKISDPKRKEQLQLRVVRAIQYMQQEQTNASHLNEVLELKKV